MPQPLYGAAAASNGIYSYAAGGIDAGGATLDTFYRYNPVNERWDTYPPPMPAAARGHFRRLLPDDEQHLRLRRQERGHVQQRHLGLRHHREHVGLRREHAGAARVHGGRLQQREREDLPGRRGELHRPAAIDVGVQPRREHVHHEPRADPATGCRFRLRSHRRPSVRGGRARRLRCPRPRPGTTASATDTWTARSSMPTPRDVPGSARPTASSGPSEARIRRARPRHRRLRPRRR